MENQTPDPQNTIPVAENNQPLSPIEDANKSGVQQPGQNPPSQTLPSPSKLNSHKKILLLIFSILVLILLIAAFFLRFVKKQDIKHTTKNSVNSLQFDNNNVYQNIKEKLIQTLK